ncbi:glycosyltransferase family 4 protein [Leucobacter sp. USCH14]|uniref:glycosyltransferase family 4 protein n=1 Tax=Leucobacter sp. USCH14 TaxID=3024838 RepID=UPI0030A83340
MAVEALLREMLDSGSLTHIIQTGERLAEAAACDPRALDALASVLAGGDQAVAIAAVHAIASIDDEAAAAVLAEAFGDPRIFIREHAAWGFEGRPACIAAVGSLVELLVEGGFGGMLAQRALESWRIEAPGTIVDTLTAALREHTSAPVRRRLTETLGLIRDPRADAELARIEHDEHELAEVREAARDALADELLTDPAIPADRHGEVDGPEGLTIAQLFLGADIDADLRTVGSGNNGGIATLLVRLGDALVDPEQGASVSRVLTLSRGTDAPTTPADATDAAEPAAHHAYAQIGLPVAAVSAEDTWSNFVAARRGIARALTEHGPVHAIHLRMADVGTFAAWDVARALDIPVVFTAAPDPHALIETLEQSGALTRQNFGDHDARDRYWFRARLVRDLARRADHTVLMPREHLRSDLQRLIGIDIDDAAQFSPVAEGIDVTVIDDAVSEARALSAGGEAGPHLDELVDLLRQLPPERRGLPLLISVGRLHRVKGMSTIVEAWSESDLQARCNLLIVGGNLVRPSADEAEQLARIDGLVDPAERAAHGLLLVGHRPNTTAARWIAAARFGAPGLAAPNGVYVCGSMKEEFGLAILEAMAAGLFVIAPLRGGPATYVDQGRTGMLIDTSDVSQLRAALDAGLTLAADAPDDRAAASRALVAERFSIHTMARSLARIYMTAHERRAADRLRAESNQYA